jgi:F-type H+-transporting ATPase subunit a
MASPLHQFEIEPLLKLPNIFGQSVHYTNSALWMTLAMLAGAGMLFLAMRRMQLVPGGLQTIAESLFGFVDNLLVDTAGKEAKPFFPLIFSVFVFVLFGNLLGMLPYSFTFTSHIIVTFALAVFLFVIITITGFVKHGLHFFSLFLPHGTPWFVAPILIPIEVFSYLIRPITLSVRLFANMMAGHVLLKVVVGFVAMLGIGGIFPLLMTVAFIGFEFFVAFLQAFIFTLLTCVYLKDAIHLH